jgi:hypothetical protein
MSGAERNGFIFDVLTQDSRRGFSSNPTRGPMLRTGTQHRIGADPTPTLIEYPEWDCKASCPE